MGGWGLGGGLRLVESLAPPFILMEQVWGGSCRADEKRGIGDVLRGRAELLAPSWSRSGGGLGGGFWESGKTPDLNNPHPKPAKPPSVPNPTHKPSKPTPQNPTHPPPQR